MHMYDFAIDKKCLLRFVMGCLHVSITFRLSIKGVALQNLFMKMGLQNKKVREALIQTGHDHSCKEYLPVRQ